MNLNKVLKVLVALFSALLVVGLCLLFFTMGKKALAVGEFKETAVQMQKTIDASEIDVTTNTINYDTYKATLNGALKAMNEGEQIVHINVGFGSLDRGLKHVNDTYGHLNGRPAIQDFSALLKDVFPEDEGWTICHRGGSGFLVFGKGQFDEEKLLGYYNTLKERWHDTPYHVANGKGTVEGMALYYCTSVAPACGTTFHELRDVLVYKKLALRDITNCGYVIVTSPDHYICSEDIDETKYMEE